MAESWPWPRTLAIGTGAVLAAGALAAGLLLGAPGEDVGAAGAIPAAERERAPELEGGWLVGPPVRLAALRRKPVVINVWASWCVPCRKEAPELARFDRQMHERAPLIGLDFQDAKSDAMAFIREFGWRFPNVSDPRGKLAGRYGVAGLPTTFVIDAEGRIARTLAGAQSYAEFVAAVEDVE